MSNSDADRREPAGEHALLLEHAEKLRSDALRTRIMALDAFCVTAETQLQLNAPDKARISMEKIRRALSEIEGHIEDPHHATPAAARELRSHLERVRPRIESLERTIRDAG
jgi:hypothetical protein